MTKRPLRRLARERRKQTRLQAGSQARLNCSTLDEKFQLGKKKTPFGIELQHPRAEVHQSERSVTDLISAPSSLFPLQLETGLQPPSLVLGRDVPSDFWFRFVSQDKWHPSPGF